MTGVIISQSDYALFRVLLKRGLRARGYNIPEKTSFEKLTKLWRGIE